MDTMILTYKKGKEGKTLREELTLNSCPWCYSQRLQLKFTRADKKRVLECLRCGLGFVERVPRDLSSLYGEEYFRKPDLDSRTLAEIGYKDYETDEALEVESNKYINLLRMYPAHGNKLLDVGCATGRFLVKAKDEGYEVQGVEISPYAAELARRKGLNVVTGDLSQAIFPDNSFDIITFFETIEHIFDLKALFSEIKRILKPEGLLVITTSDAFSYGAETAKDNWVGAKISLEHIYYLGRKSLKRLLEDTGGFSILILASAGPGEINLCDIALAIAKKTTSYRKSKPKKKILFVGNEDILFKHGGATIHLLKTKECLEKLGLEIQVDVSLKPNPLGYDLVHIFGSYKPEHYLPQIKWLKQYKVPILLTPIYMDFSELIYARKIWNRKFQKKDKFSLREKLKLLLKRFELYPGFERAQKEFFQLCDYLLPNSYTEMEKIRKNFGLKLPFSKVPVAVDEKFLLKASPETFKEKYKISDFVLCVGSIEFRKNQLMVILALKDTDLPLVLIGSVGENEYYEVCKRYVSDEVIILQNLSPDLLASAYKNARVHVLASWQEGASLVNLEAALAGCNIVVSDRSSEKEYFGESAYYCNPASSASIREAILKAWNNYEKDKEKRTQLQRTILQKYNWQEVAHQTLKIYENFF